MVELENEDLKKFEKFSTGKLKLNIAGEEFELGILAEERLPILQYLIMSSKNTAKDKILDDTIIKTIKKKLFIAFKREYKTVPDNTLEEFIDTAFEQIVGEIAIASKWTTREQIKEAIEDEVKKNE